MIGNIKFLLGKKSVYLNLIKQFPCSLQSGPFIKNLIAFIRFILFPLNCCPIISSPVSLLYKLVLNKFSILLENLYGNIKLFDINSNHIYDNYFNTKMTKIIGVKIILDEEYFSTKTSGLIKFDYTKVMKKCCFANIVCVSPPNPWLNPSLENEVSARIHNIDLVQIIIGIINNNKKEKLEISLVLFGN